ncbi:VWA domain-containing protein [Alloacidobacterium sp.]|uniref:VWA domain-containing protein n=1 Tax=Alloacidobacterium sp. TaxID=2951999 RepID=UPI002D687A1B|nr:VWA domain-containing protein [Alloacidobacterium sp.]HYK35171.1 VWA domain-containing protein [Alloacidobacterium sp.]
MAVALAFLMLGGFQQQQPQSIPDAPAPQPAGSTGLSNLKNEVTPGKSAGPEAVQTAPPPANPSPSQSSSSSSDQSAPQQDNTQQQEAPVIPKPGETGAFLIRQTITYVDVPVTVRDKKHQLVSGLTWRQFKVYEDGARQRIAFFSVDPLPLSVAFVIDQSVPSDVMAKVNESLSAVTGAFTPSDTVAIFAYNSSTRMVTDFTGAQGARLPAAFQSAKAPGRDMGVVSPGGPLDDGMTINNKPVDPNLTPQRGNTGFIVIPKEVHPLNDAILEAAKSLAQQPKGRRRVLYIISDGKEAGSKASYKEVVRYLLANNISVYGTLVGDSAMWGVGYLDKWHIPLLPTMRDNILPKYALATGGALQSQFSENGIQNSFAKITESVRAAYTLGYYTHAGVMSDRFHKITVNVEVPNLDVTAKDGYYPSPSMRQ